MLLPGLLQRSILGLPHLNIFINDLYLWITKTNLLNFADGNTVTAAKRTIENRLSTLATEGQAAIEWFELMK